MRRLKRKFELHEPGFNAAVSAALRLREHGFAAGLVGGSVRDLLLGKVPSDFDLVTSAKPEELAQLFADFRAVGASFGVSLIGVGGVSRCVSRPGSALSCFRRPGGRFRRWRRRRPDWPVSGSMPR